MRNLAPPPLNVPMLDANSFVTPTWRDWFNAAYQRIGAGDSDNLSYKEDAWTPSLTGVSIAGTVDVSGRYWKVGSILFFEIYVSPNGGTTASNAGATINNLPFQSRSVGTLSAVDTSRMVRLGEGSIQEASKVLSLPTWTVNANQIVIAGSVRV